MIHTNTVTGHQTNSIHANKTLGQNNNVNNSFASSHQSHQQVPGTGIGWYVWEDMLTSVMTRLVLENGMYV